MLTGSYGACAIIIYGMHGSPIAQPKNVVLGNMVGGLLGVLVFETLQFLGLNHFTWLGPALCVSLTTLVQEVFNITHPPGGALSLIFVLGPSNMHATRFWFVYCPAFLSSGLLVLIGVVVNNMSEERSYPKAWWHSSVGSPLTAALTPATTANANDQQDSAIQKYFRKWLGSGTAPPAKQSLKHHAWSFIGAFIGIACLGLLHTHVTTDHDMACIVGAFGATSIIIWSLHGGPAAQPKNVVVGCVVGAIVGVLVIDVLQFLGLYHWMWLGAALCVSGTMAAQELLNVVHPPGAAVSLIFVMGKVYHPNRFWYVLSPGLTASVTLVVCAAVINNLSKERSYPKAWWHASFAS
jgi:CBS-domain-containing membrane protein